MFNKREFSNFLIYIKKHPFFTINTLVEFMILSSHAFIQRVVFKFISDKHLFLKKKPKNVFINELNSKNLQIKFDVYLPSYDIHILEINKPKPVQYNDIYDDVEAYYAQNRLTHCINALFEDQINTAISIENAFNWIRKEIPKSDKAWEPYSCSERVANFGILLSKSSYKLIPEDQKLLYNFILEHIYWIDSHLEFYNASKTNNHILNNCRALIIGGVIINNKFAVERGLLLFDKMASELILENGFLRERSTHYQIIITNWLLDSIHFANSYSNLSSTSEKALLSLKKLSEKVIYCTKIVLNFLTVNTTQIGDISPDYPPALAIEKLKLLYLGEISPQKLENIYIDNWLFMSVGTNTLISNLVSNTFPLNYPTHGHNDLGSFIWFNNSSPIIVDPGRYRYTSDKVSISQLSTGNHNTILVNELAPLADSLKSGGNWYPFKYANAKIKGTIINDNEFIIEHTGFQRVNKVGIHFRRFKINESELHVEDILEGEGFHTITLNWHMGPDFTQIAFNEFKFNNESSTVSFLTKDNNNSICELSTGNYYLSSEYGQFQESICINALYKCKLPTTIITTFKIN